MYLKKFKKITYCIKNFKIVSDWSDWAITERLNDNE